MRKRRPGWGLFQESRPVRFEGFPASPHAQSNREEDETCRAAAEFATIKSCRGVADSTRSSQQTSLKKRTVTPTVTVLRASTVPPEKAKGDMPYGIPVPGHKGMVTSPYSPEGNYIDVSAFAPGSAVRDPYTGKIFLVP